MLSLTIFMLYSHVSVITPDRRQSKKSILLTHTKIARNRVFDCHLSPDWRQMAIENTVSSHFDPRLSIVKSIFDCRLSGVVMLFSAC